MRERTSDPRLEAWLVGGYEAARREPRAEDPVDGAHFELDRTADLDLGDEHGGELEPADLALRIDVWNLEPVPTEPIACTAIYGIVENNVALGSDFESGREYTVIVNGEDWATFVTQ